MANTIGTGTYASSSRAKYLTNTMQMGLRSMLVAEKICQVDRTDSRYIHNPYITAVTATLQAIAGTYAVSAMTVTDNSLTVADEVIYSCHVRDWEQVLSNYDFVKNFGMELTAAVAEKIDQYVINVLCEDATGSYDASSGGGLTQASNVPIVFSNCISKVSGYADIYKGLFIVIEAQDMPAVMQAMGNSGYSYADMALRNGFMDSYMGVEIYVVKNGTFVSDTLGSYGALTNSGHRLFGVKGVATYAAPRGIQYQEKTITAETGWEIVVWGYVGIKAWYQKTGLLVDIQLA